MSGRTTCYVRHYNLVNVLNVVTPLFFSSVVGTLMLSVDRIVLGMYSLNAMNVSSVVGNYISIILFFLCAITSIAAVFVGQFNGEHRFEKTSVAVWQMIYFSLATIPFLLLINFLATTYCFLPACYVDEGMAYMQCLTCFGFVHPLFSAITAFFIGMEKIFIITLTVVTCNILNLILDIIFVFGIEGYIPQMGTLGAGIATVVANLVGVIYLFSVFLNHTNSKLFNTRDCSFNRAIFINCCRIGFPLAFCRSLNVGAWFFIFLLISYASDNLATMESITMTLYFMFACYTECLNKGIMIISANLIGENRIGEIHEVYKIFLKMNLLFSTIISIPLVFCPSLIFYLIEQLNGDVPYLKDELICIFYILYFTIFADEISWITSGILTSGGDTLYPSFVNTTLLWIIVVIPTAYMYYSHSLTSIKEVNLCSLLCSVLTAIILFFRYRKGTWRRTVI